MTNHSSPVTDNGLCENTDREIWRGPDDGCGDAYADSLHITKEGSLGINCGGCVYVKPIREWHRLAGGGPIAAHAQTQPDNYWQDMYTDLLKRVDAQSTLEDMARLSASEVACYRWPEDTAEHRAMRAAFCDGAAHTAVTSTVHSPQQETAHSSTDSNTTEKTKGGAAPYTLEETEPHIEAPYGYTPQATAEGE